MEETQRTLKQNNSLHRYLRELAGVLNDAGLDTKKVIEKFPIEIQWTEFSTKVLLWKTIQETLYGKESTRELTTKEVKEVYEHLNRFLATMGVESVPWPSEEEISLSQLEMIGGMKESPDCAQNPLYAKEVLKKMRMIYAPQKVRKHNKI